LDNYMDFEMSGIFA